MGAEAVAVFKVVEFIAEVVSGDQKREAAKEEAEAIKRESDIEFEDTLAEAELRKESGERFRDEQLLGFVASGVELKGSPMQVLEETERAVGEEYEQAISRAENVKELRRQRAHRTAKAGEQEFGMGLVRGIGALGELST